MSISEFLHMGGYAAYVWTSYAIWLLVMVVNLVLPIVQLRETRARLSRLLQQEDPAK